MSGIAAAGREKTDIAVAGGAWFPRAFAFVLYIMLLPVMALVALAVAIFLGRPLLFVQERAGLHAVPFPLVKFRSLKDLRDANGNVLPDADRTNALSGLLRRSRLDELPQLLCIARGQMAFIGPRPLLPVTIRNLGEAGQRRCAVRPGITGWAQVCGNTALDDVSKIALDIWYIDNRNWRLDLQIVLETVLTLLAGEKKAQLRINRAMTHLRDRYGWRPETMLNDGSKS